MADSLFATSKLKINVSPWETYMLPTMTNLDSFKISLPDHIADFRCDHLIIGGDFNLVLDLNKDKKGGRSKTHTNSVKTLEKFIDELNLIDVWRVLNPDIPRYTWCQKKNRKFTAD